MNPEIIILALIAAFLGMRLYSVLGQRAEHDEEQIAQNYDPSANAPPPEAPPMAAPPKPANGSNAPAAEVVPISDSGLRKIASADRSFDAVGFLEGAKGAYAMVLEAFWAGDRETLRELCDDDVYASFEAAITAREDAGETLENTLIRIEEASIDHTWMDGNIARIAVRFVADIAAVTRNADGDMIAGSLDDAIESRDIWTFMRDVTSSDPNWLLDETDEG